MSSQRIAVLYEDARAMAKGFALHDLLVACVADLHGLSEYGPERQALGQRLRAVPKKGSHKLLTACVKQVPDMPEAVVFALFDADKLHRLLLPSGNPGLPALEVELRKRCPDPKLRVHVLVENTESVVDAAALALGVPVPPQKSHLSREGLLQRAAWREPAQIRRAIIDAVPSFAALVEAVEAELALR